MVDTRRIFVSYEYNEDKELKNQFLEQARTRDLPIVIEDYSLEEDHRDPRWKQKAIPLIRRCSMMVILIGLNTHNSSGVREEVQIADSLRKPIIQVKRKNQPYGEVEGAGKVYPWKWKILDKVLVKGS